MFQSNISSKFGSRFASAFEAPTFQRYVGKSLLPETQALLSRMEVQPDTSRKLLIDKTIRSLKADGIWPLLGFLHIQAAHHSQAGLLDWTGNGYDFSNVNGLGFTTDRGFMGAPGGRLEISNQWLSIRNVSLNSMFVGGWANLGTAYNAALIGSNTYTMALYPRMPSDSIQFRISSSVGATSNMQTQFKGFTAASAFETSTRVFRNGNLVASAPRTPASHTGIVYALAVQSASLEDQCAASVCGAALTDTQHAALYATLNNYMQEVGNV